jgi:hypothetical protein
VSSDASPRTEELAAEAAAPEPAARPPAADSPAARSDVESPAEAAPAAGTEAPEAAEPASTDPGDSTEAEAEGEAELPHGEAELPLGGAEPPEPVGRIAGALDWAWDNRFVRVGLFAAIVVGVLAVWSSHDTVSDNRNATVQDAAVNARPPDPADIATVAAAAGCTPRTTVRNSGYTQAVCVTPAARMTITTFATDKGQRDWLDEAIPYGGAYLIGKRWVVGGNDPTGMNTIAASLGGTIIDHSKDHD